MENWVPSQQTQIDDEDVLVDNTQIDNKDGRCQTTKKKKNMTKERVVEPIMMNLRLTTFNIANANGVTHCSKPSPAKTNSIEIWKHDEKRIKKKALLNLFVVGELPFKFVENEAFIKYINALNGKVVLQCTTTISKRVADYYVEEKAKLNKFFSNPLTNVHLPTDCWTSSCQPSSYKVVTTHFIDKDWVMHKRVINFKSLNSYRGEDIGRTLLTCFEGWGINNVMTITIDNVISNDKAIEFLTKNYQTCTMGGNNYT
uniref:Uncharacterized protein n=1 Tax=Lactuca sativa TaxID=4236 RepID=A0A9R1XNG6_LACSA|nr:hypothetical protein LSAT_V11C300133610 [Lactuca sativa]